MLGRIILLALQIAVAWLAGPIVRGYVPAPGAADLFLYAAIFAVLAYVTGVLAALVIKDVGAPSGSTLTWSLMLALIAAAAVTFGQAYIPQIPGNAVSKRGIVLAGALLGYLLKR